MGSPEDFAFLMKKKKRDRMMHNNQDKGKSSGGFGSGFGGGFGLGGGLSASQNPRTDNNPPALHQQQMT